MKFHHGPSVGHHSIRHIRLQHHRLQRPHKRPSDSAARHLYAKIPGCRGFVLDSIVVSAERESRPERLYPHLRRIPSGVLYLSGDFPGGYPPHHSDGLLHPYGYVPDIYNGHCSNGHQGADNLAESRRSDHKFHRHHLSDNQQSDCSGRCYGKYSFRYSDDNSQQSQFLYVSRDLQTIDIQILGCHVYEMDFPLLGSGLHSPFAERTYRS